MPYIKVTGGSLTAEQKDLLIKHLTQVASEIMEVPSEFFMTVIEELPDQNIGIGGRTIGQIKQEYQRSTGDLHE